MLLVIKWEETKVPQTSSPPGHFQGQLIIPRYARVVTPGLRGDEGRNRVAVPASGSDRRGGRGLRALGVVTAMLRGLRDRPERRKGAARVKSCKREGQGVFFRQHLPVLFDQP